MVRIRSTFAVLCAIAAGTALASCGQGGTAKSNPGVVTTPDTKNLGDGDKTSDLDSFGEEVEVVGGQCEFSANPLSGEPGAACSSDAECDSGYCLDSLGGKICTRTCSSCCPNGFTCGQVGADDPISVCIPMAAGACRPCVSDAQCVVKGDDTALCLSYGDAGSFCGGRCKNDIDCPAGYACGEEKGTSGTSKQCRLKSGECTCSERAIAAGAMTTCTMTNAAGACKGQRKCEAGGLTACDAQTPTAETCNDLDDDCDGMTDNPDAKGCEDLWLDGDGDGFGLAAASGGKVLCLCKSAGPYTSKVSTDCNDADKAVNPSVSEVCNDFDDDCDGQTDEGCDGDNDGFCNANIVIVGAPKICTKGLGDCDDGKPSVHPGSAEQCNDLDDNCNSLTDEGCDVDKDGYCDADAVTTGTPKVCASGGGDCDDGNSAVNPGTTEICNGLDDNCNATTDDGCDADGDGYCNAKLGLVGIPAVCPKGGGDCNDGSVAIAPDVTEICNDIDDNCNGVTDEGCDKDKDGWCDLAVVTVGTPSICPKGGGDCNDNAVSIAPDASETCNDADDNCDGVTDEDCDKDGDGYCDSTWPVTGKPLACPKGGGDCDDTTIDISPAIPEICFNTVDDNCDGVTDEGMDAAGCSNFYKDEDKDGFGTADGQCTCAAIGLYTAATNGDCADADPNLHPAKPEICGNGKDDNCNGAMDEANAIGCVDFYTDADSDLWGAGDAACLCAPDTTHTVKKAGDCDDKDPVKNPGLTEVCNGFDDNCDGVTDSADSVGCKKFFIDIDLDKFGDSSKPACLCVANDTYTTDAGADCDDTNAEINPGTKEICNSFDDNCDGATDEINAKGCVLSYVDADADTYGDIGQKACLCKLTVPYVTVVGGDCNDKNESIHPGVTEVCNGFDDNCNSAIDEKDALGCSPYFLDADGDTFGVDGQTECRCTATTPYTGLKGGDCDDTSSNAKPGGTEMCDGHDNDCNGITDEQGALGCTVFYADSDKDFFGTDFVPQQCMCAPKGIMTAKVGGDCDDKNANVYPTAPEYCDGKDTNCNSITDDLNATGCQTWYMDFDNDTYGLTSDSKCSCGATGLYKVQQKGDCDDHKAAVSPGAKEICDGVDNDCNSITDVDSPDAKTYYLDTDNDSWGAATAKTLCFPQGAYKVLLTGDCDDSNPIVHPNQQESCNNIDDDCNGVTDEQDASGCIKYYVDADVDGHGNQNISACLCKPNATYLTATPDDCDDNQPKSYPGKKEVCDGIDNNCDTFVDEEDAGGCVPYYVDGDGDSWGDPNKSKCYCEATGIYVSLNGKDCNDTNVYVFPGAQEVCNGVEDNCNNKIDEEGALNCQLFMYDGDSDSYGVTGNNKCLCAGDPVTKFVATKGSDCDDNKPAVNPGVGEQCGDGVDNNCDGTTDSPGAIGCNMYFPDSDKDGYGGNSPPQQCLCLPTGIHTATLGGDCDDGNAFVYPTAYEKCNKVDDNCDGAPDNSPDAQKWYFDQDADNYGGAAFITQCFAAGFYTAPVGTDCDDSNGTVHPGAQEVCNHLDDNCNSVVDENATGTKTFYYDHDNDGYGLGASQQACFATDFYTAVLKDDCNDEDATIHPNAVEVCNGKNDDCDATTDEDPAGASCAPTSSGTGVCVSGACKNACVAGKFDVDGSYSNGCECQGDADYGKGNGGSTAMDLGTLTDAGMQKQQPGMILPTEAGDWYKVYAQDLGQGDGAGNTFSLKVNFTSNPDGKYVVDLYRGGYDPGSILCTNINDTGWTVKFSNAAASGPGSQTGVVGGGICPPGDVCGKNFLTADASLGGEWNCYAHPQWNSSMPNLHVNYCHDNSAVFYIRVYRTAAATTCDNAKYTLQVSNGL